MDSGIVVDIVFIDLKNIFLFLTRTRNELLSEINPDELDIILNPGKYDETNSDMNSQNSQGQIIKEEASNSPRYTQLQPSSSQNPSQMPGLGHAYPNPYQNPYPGMDRQIIKKKS